MARPGQIETSIRHVPGPQARSQGIRKGVTFCGGSGGAPHKIFKFKVANTPKFNDFLQLPKKFRMSKYLLLMTEMPDLLQAAFPEAVFNALHILKIGICTIFDRHSRWLGIFRQLSSFSSFY